METKKTALFDQHVALGAKMVPFAGYMMPIQYSGIIDEHLTVRKQVGVFDVSHMGEFIVRGENAERWLNYMVTNNIAKMEPGGVLYSALLYDDGGIVDDLLIYRMEDHFMLVVNASNLEKDFQWLQSHIEKGVEMINRSDEVTLLAIQGPNAIELVAQLTEVKINDMQYYSFRQGQIAGVNAIISRTGYTGEVGFEIYISNNDALVLWNMIFSTGKNLGLKPIGLGARDSLRLEVAYCLYGNDIDKTTNPIEAGLGWIVKTKKKDGFIGLKPVMELKEKGLTRKLCGFVMEGKGIPRHNQDIFIEDTKAGYVTSGGYAPAIDCVVGMAYIEKFFNDIGKTIEIDIRGKRIPAKLVQLPFYKPATSNS